MDSSLSAAVLGVVLLCSILMILEIRRAGLIQTANASILAGAFGVIFLVDDRWLVAGYFALVVSWAIQMWALGILARQRSNHSESNVEGGQ